MGRLDLRRHAGVGLSGAATLEIALAAGADISGTVQLVLVPLPSFTVGGSITVSPFVRIAAHVGATVDADARISIVAPFAIVSGFSYDGSTGAATSTPRRYVPEVGLPDTAVDLSGRVLPTGDGLIVVEEGQNPWLAGLDGLGVPRWQHPAVDPWTPNAMAYAATAASSPRERRATECVSTGSSRVDSRCGPAR